MVGNTSEPLDLTEELRLRRWARENYVPPAERDSSWHPVILDEMVRRDFEGNVGVEAEVPSEDEDIADDSTITIDVEKSWGELFVPIAELHCLHGPHELPPPHVYNPEVDAESAMQTGTAVDSSEYLG